MVASINRGTQIWTPIYYSPSSADPPQNGTPNFRKTSEYQNGGLLLQASHYMVDLPPPEDGDHSALVRSVPASLGTLGYRVEG